jgi:hypothetical protein
MWPNQRLLHEALHGEYVAFMEAAIIIPRETIRSKFVVYTCVVGLLRVWPIATLTWRL